MKYFILLKENIRNQKGIFVGLFILVFIITVSLCSVLTIWNNNYSYEKEQLERMGYGDITAWVRQMDEEQLKRIETLDTVEKIGRQRLVFVSCAVKEEDYDGSCMVTSYDGITSPYKIYREDLSGIVEQPKAPRKGEIYVPPFFITRFGAGIGDQVTVEITGEADVATYTIAGYFEDPFMGSAMMGMKTLLLNEADLQELTERMEAAGENAVGIAGEALHIFKAEDCALTANEFQTGLNEAADLKNNLLLIYQKSTVENFMLILQNIFAGVLIAFVTVLLFVCVLVLSHSITTGVEQDFVDIGILRTLGITKTKLRLVKLAQYLSSVLLGMLAGIPVSALITKLVNRLTVPATGLMAPGRLPAALCAAALISVLLFLAGIIYLKTARIGKITPIQAIRHGKDTVFFKSRLILPVGGGCLNLQLAFRQLISGKKQYASTCFVTALLVFFLSMSGTIGAWMGADGEGLMNSFGMARYDLGVRCRDDATQREVDGIVASYSQITASWQVLITNGNVNQMDYRMNVMSDPEYYNLLEGRTCKFANEILLTETVAKSLGVNIGDTVKVTYEEACEDFIISGTYQCANDMGGNFGISAEGFYRLGGDSETRFYTYYQLEDAAVKQEIAAKLSAAYGENIDIDENTWSGLSSILMAADALGTLMYLISVIFILVVIQMTGSKILYQEQSDLMIYKLLGARSGRLRMMFALRFGIVAAAGSVMGIVLSLLFTDRLVGAVLEFVGISHFASGMNAAQRFFPGGLVVLLFLVFACALSGKIKQTGMRLLTVE